MSRFLQIHTLTSYPGALLNRDDVGFAKRLPFGGVTRTRVSSQCLKRHWRTHEGEHSLREIGVPMSVRSRLTFDRHIYRPLIDGETPDPVARAATDALMALVLGKSQKAKASKSEEKEERVQTGQITVLGLPELEFLLSEAKAVCDEANGDPKLVAAALKGRLGKDGKKNLHALKCAAGLDAALFGRMVTSDILARGDAALHVAHAFTVHPEESESDYFSAVDDLLADGDDEQLGSGHIGTTELTSGLFYGYVVVDVPLLVSNIEGCKREEWKEADSKLSAEVISRLVRLVATVSPGAKLGSTAPHSYAHLAMVESGSAQPRTLANAFLTPVSPRPDLVGNTYGALAGHVAQLDAMYGGSEQRRYACLGPAEILTEMRASRLDSLAGVADWASRKIRGDE